MRETVPAKGLRQTLLSSATGALVDFTGGRGPGRGRGDAGLATGGT